MPKYNVSQPAIALCIESRSSRSPTTTSAPLSRSACARSSSLRTIARTALPCFNSSSVTARPTAPTLPAAPVTRMGLAMIFTLYLVGQQKRWFLKLRARALHDAVIAFRAGAECSKRLLVRVALVSRQRNLIAVEFDNDGALPQSGFVGLDLAFRTRQKASTKRLDGWHCQCRIGIERSLVRN